MDTFTQAYVECALWSSTDNSRDDGGDPLNANYGVEDIAAETLKAMEEAERQAYAIVAKAKGIKE